MCSIAMPTDYEVLLSHSPPIFSQSYFGCRYTPQRSATALRRQFTPPNGLAVLKLQIPSQPVRPCLVTRPEDPSSSGEENDPPSPTTRIKKKVIFADDKGLSLTQVSFIYKFKTKSCKRLLIGFNSLLYPIPKIKWVRAHILCTYLSICIICCMHYSDKKKYEYLGIYLYH